MFGLVFGFVMAMNLAIAGLARFVAIIVVSVVTCGLLAARFGDRFWHRLRHLKWLYWLGP